MLGKNRFQFESPNAVDAGDTPPSAPTRPPKGVSFSDSKAKSADDGAVTPPTPERRIVNTSMSYVDARDNATDFLKDIEVSPTSFSRETFRDEEDPDMYDQDDDEDGDEQLKAALTHSVNLSKSYAASLASNSPWSKTDRHSLVQPNLHDGVNQPLRPTWRRPSRRTLAVPDRKNPDEDEQPTLSKRLIVFFCLAPLVLIALVLVYLSHVVKNSEESAFRNNGNSNNVPSSEAEKYFSDRLMKTIDVLATNNISDRKDLSVQGTPQFLAARWMADVDPLQYAIPSMGMNATAESYHFVQRYVLVLLFHATGGPDTWSNYLNFLSPDHECSWFHSKEFTDGQVYSMGVSCRGAELQVSDLLIPANHLKGSLPAELAQLTHLQLLSFSHNNLRGSMPDLSKLSNLEYLDLGSNSLSGSIPDWIGSMSRLKVLGLEKNRLEGHIPSLASLTKLITLDLKKNTLQGNINGLEGLVDLRYLYLGSNEFAEYLDPELFLINLGMIEEIDISNNLFYGDSFPVGLMTKPHLKVLDISSNGLRGSLPENLPANSVLEVLEIDGNAFNSTIPSSIDSLVSLTHLDLSQNSFTGTIPDRFVNLRKLTYLALGENDFVAGTIPAFLSSFTELRELSLARCNLVGEIPSWVDILSSLRFLNLQANRLHGTVPQQLWDLPDLSILLLTENNLNGTIPEQMSNGQGLKILALGENAFTGEADAICASAPSLEALSFECGKVGCSSECCNTCCAEVVGTDSSSCFSKQLMMALGREQDNWEHKAQSNAYSFSPGIVYSEPATDRSAQGVVTP